MCYPTWWDFLDQYLYNRGSDANYVALRSYVEMPHLRQGNSSYTEEYEQHAIGVHARATLDTKYRVGIGSVFLLTERFVVMPASQTDYPPPRANLEAPNVGTV